MKTLTDLELAKIAELDLQDELLNAKIVIADQKVKLYTLQQKLLSYDLRDSNNNIAELKGRLDKVKTERREYLKSVQKKHRIKGQWGFDPDSGVIKED